MRTDSYKRYPTDPTVAAGEGGVDCCKTRRNTFASLSLPYSGRDDPISGRNGEGRAIANFTRNT